MEGMREETKRRSDREKGGWVCRHTARCMRMRQAQTHTHLVVMHLLREPSDQVTEVRSVTFYLLLLFPSSVHPLISWPLFLFFIFTWTPPLFLLTFSPIFSLFIPLIFLTSSFISHFPSFINLHPASLSLPLFFSLCLPSPFPSSSSLFISDSSLLLFAFFHKCHPFFPSVFCPFFICALSNETRHCSH